LTAFFNNKAEKPSQNFHNLTGPFEDRTSSRTHTRYKVIIEI